MDAITNQSLSVGNASETAVIYVRFRPPEDANTPSPPDNSIAPGKVERVAVKDGTMNLFVWTDPSATPVWTGIIPTKVKGAVVISPEHKKVLYDGVEIPEGFGPVTDLTGPGFKVSSNGKSPSQGWWTYFIVAFLIVLILFGVLWYLGKLPQVFSSGAKTKSGGK